MADEAFPDQQEPLPSADDAHHERLLRSFFFHYTYPPRGIHGVADVRLQAPGDDPPPCDLLHLLYSWPAFHFLHR